MSITDTLPAAAAIYRALWRWERPDRLPRSAMVFGALGATFAGALGAATMRYPRAVAVIDRDTRYTYGELWQRSQALARVLADEQPEPAPIGLMCENSVDFVVGLAAISIHGADVVLMNTGFAVPQLADVAAREGCDRLLASDRYTSVCEAVMPSAVISTTAGRPGPSRVPSRRASRVVILTSGTTGTPKGARRSSGDSRAAVGLLQRIPVRSGDRVLIASPMFHAWGLAQTVAAITFASTMIVDRDLAPSAVAGLIDRYQVDGLVVVPVVLRRIVESAAPPPQHRVRYIASSGSAITPSVVTASAEYFGPVLYNVYGSTEVALATVAGPDDLAIDPTTAGRRLPGIRVELLDEHGAPVAPGATGRVFVDSGAAFDGYTGGGDKERIGSLVSTGDVGHFVDELLMIDGRSDDMIISGGENVFPGEVENTIGELAGVADVAVVGVDDDEFGQRLAAFVVLDPNVEHPPTVDEIRDGVRSSLARFKVPRDVVFVDQIPRTETGKIRRQQLR